MIQRKRVVGHNLFQPFDHDIWQENLELNIHGRHHAMPYLHSER
jgi:hypothetical protein